MKLPIYDIKNTCNKWMQDNGFANVRFEEADKNEICFLINRFVRPKWDDESLFIEGFRNGKLSEKQNEFLDMLCDKHNLIKDVYNGYHILMPGLDMKGIFEDLDNLLNK